MRNIQHILRDESARLLIEYDPENKVFIADIATAREELLTCQADSLSKLFGLLNQECDDLINRLDPADYGDHDWAKPDCMW